MNPLDQTADQWQTVETLFETASELPPAGRQEWLAANCADPAIREEREQLLLACLDPA